MAQIQTYKAQRFAAPTHVEGVDSSSLISALHNFQAEAERRLVDKATAEAKLSGQAEGEAAFREGRAIEGGRPDTAAGAAYLKAAEAQWYARVEVDAQEAAQSLVEEWQKGDVYHGQLGPWEQARSKAAAGLLNAADPPMAERAGPRVQRIFDRARDVVVADYQARKVESARADVARALEAQEREALQDARDPTTISIDARTGLPTSSAIEAFRQTLANAVEARLYRADDVERKVAEFSQKIVAETYRGDFEDAVDKKAYIDEFKANPPETLTPTQHRSLADWMEGEKTALENRDRADVALTVFAGQILDPGATIPEMSQHALELFKQKSIDAKTYGLIQGHIAREASQRSIQEADLAKTIQAKTTQGEVLTGVEEGFVKKNADLAKWVDAERKRVQNGQPPVTEPLTWTNLLLKPEAELADLDPTEYLPFLAPPDYDRFVRLVAKARSDVASTGAPGATASLYSLGEEVRRAAAQRGLVPSGPTKRWGTKDHSTLDRLMTAVQGQIEADGVRPGDHAGVRGAVDKVLRNELTASLSWIGAAELVPSVTLPPDAPILIKKAGSSDEYWDEDLAASARQTLIQNGYPNPTEDDIRQLLEYNASTKK